MMKKSIILFSLILLLFCSCRQIKSTVESENYSFEGFSKEETIAWLQNKLEKDLVRPSSGYPDISLVRVEPCFIFYGYELVSLSGLPSKTVDQIPTDDIRIKKDGSIMYTVGLKSNCPAPEEEEMNIRMTASEIKVRRLGDDGHHRLTLAIQHLNSFCKKE